MAQAMSPNTAPVRKLSDLQPPPPYWDELLSSWLAAYPHQPQRRLSAEPLDDLIETLLVQQNQRSVAQKQYQALRHAYPRWEAALLDGPDGIEGVLRSAGGGLSRVKAGYIWSVLSALEGERESLSLRFIHDLSDQAARAALEALPGVGMKTASLLLLFDLGRPAMPVDNNIWRITKRLELVPMGWSSQKVERWYDEVLPRDWTLRAQFHRAGVWHGRQICQKNPLCNSCPLLAWCPTGALSQI